jgi:hypothetical protein
LARKSGSYSAMVAVSMKEFYRMATILMLGSFSSVSILGFHLISKITVG